MNDPQLPAHEVAARAAHEAAAHREIRMNLEALADDAVAEGLARALVELLESEIEALAADSPVNLAAPRVDGCNGVPSAGS